MKLTCQRGLGPCTFVVDAIGLTAKRGADFTARTSPSLTKLKIRRAGRSMVATVRFTALDDGVCEGTELARVRVTKRTRRKGGRRDYGTVTIKDADCETPTTPTAPAPTTPGPTTPAPDPVPGGPAPAFPPDAGTPTVRTTALTNGTLGECTTPQWIGTEATAGANGWFNRGCAVKVACPPVAAVDGVATIDFKGQYGLEVEDEDALVAMYERAIAAFPDAVLEDPHDLPAVRELLEPIADRVSYDAPVTTVASLDATPIRVGIVNVKPCRVGRLSELGRLYAHCEAQGIRMYNGGMGELGVGRGQAQLLASLLHPDAPNDIAPSDYNLEAPPAELPASPLDPAPDRGFRRR
ncbi:hypothetical protein SK069_16835 [Patulibacter brassicae]|uniref:Enolase C-terminal domain-containing protein n=1 Tax=Patulibacter brassicae TaxID=1705717 RepID=A0ABU4VN47_9ACTN|nr:hypothetical protein [Patulibacter brassicae]MDX8153267.1 hypothetical protein [Patulibacter brassicae]